MTIIKEPKCFSTLDLILPQKVVVDDNVFSKVIANEMDYNNLFEDLCK
jgi:hypothetical protein